MSRETPVGAAHTLQTGTSCFDMRQHFGDRATGQFQFATAGASTRHTEEFDDQTCCCLHPCYTSKMVASTEGTQRSRSRKTPGDDKSMFCEVFVTPAAVRSLAFLRSHCSCATEWNRLLQCARILRGVLQYDPAQQGINYRVQPSRRVFHRGPLSVHHDLLFRNGKWIVEIVAFGRNASWVW